MVVPTIRRVAVIGAGAAGLSVAWNLQRHGVRVEVLDRVGVAGGASRGNAGWLTPALAGPLPEPAVLRYGLRAVLDRGSPLHISPRPHRGLYSFLARFARNSTSARWHASLGHLAAINAMAFDAFDELEQDGVEVAATATDILAIGRTAGELEHLRGEVDAAVALGLDAGAELISGAQTRELEPQLSDVVDAGLLISGQRTFDPGLYCRELAHAFEQRGGELTAGVSIVSIRELGSGVELTDVTDTRRTYDAAVVSTGAWANQLLRPFGVKVPIQSGRGYSFTLADRATVGRPVYLPAQRVVCTPLVNGTRVAGTMEIGSPSSPFRPARVRQIADSVAPYLDGDLGRPSEQWCGSRPCSADGLPLVGATASPRVFAHGGHGMWGMTQSPATGRLLAEAIVTGRPSEVLAPFDPRR